MPGAALGLFAARALGEAVGLPTVWLAVLLGIALAAGGAWLLARWPVARTWPALLLLAYVVWPEVNPAARLWLPAVAIAALLLNERARGESGPRGRDANGRLTLAISVALFAAALWLYVATLAPDVLPADSGELQTVAAQLGVAHPPGFPLYVMLAHLFTRLPLGPAAWSVNLLSAVVAAITVAVVYRTGRRLTGSHVAALTGALALATATTFWSQATTANVRSLTVLFAALLIDALVRFRIATMAAADRPTSRPTATADRALIEATLWASFGLTHHVSLLFLAAVGVIFVLVVDPAFMRTPRRWGQPLAVALLGLLPLLYLPLRAGAAARGASPQLATLPGFLEHVLALGFRGDLFYYLAPADLGPRLLIMGNVMTFQFAPLLLAGMVVGLALLWRERALALLLGGTFLVYVLVAATYRAPQTVEYMMPAYVPAALVLAYAIGRLPGVLPRRRGIGRAFGVLFAALMLAAAASQLPGHMSAAGARHEAGDTRATTGRLLDGAPPNAIILAHWHWATPLWYLREVEGLRPDVETRFVFPEGEAYDTTWARRTAEAFAGGQPVITTWAPAAPLAGLPVPEPIGEALLYPQTARTELPDGYRPATLQLGDHVEALGYELQTTDGTVVPGEEVVVTLAWRARGSLPEGLNLFAHLVAADGTLYGQDDRPAVPAAGVTLTQFRLTPRPATPAGELTLFVGASDAGERQALAPVTVSAAATPPFTRHAVHRTALDGTTGTLVGYDWDQTVPGRARLYLHWQRDGRYSTQVVDNAVPALPAYRGPWGVPRHNWPFSGRGADSHYVPLGQGIVWADGTLAGRVLAPAESTVLSQTFHSARPVNRDHVVSVRLIGLEPDGFHWAWWDLRDAIPAMGAIPTLKWASDATVHSPHRVTVAATAVPGQSLTGALTLYDAFTGRPLPILDEGVTAGQPWIPLGQGRVSETP